MPAYRMALLLDKRHASPVAQTLLSLMYCLFSMMMMYFRCLITTLQQFNEKYCRDFVIISLIQERLFVWIRKAVLGKERMVAVYKSLLFPIASKTKVCLTVWKLLEAMRMQFLNMLEDWKSINQ